MEKAMSIHQKFVALFNAAPGAYVSNAALDNTETLVNFVGLVTGVNVSDDSDFIDLVIGNMGLIEDEDPELWATAHTAMSGLIGSVGRAAAVDTAIQFLEAQSENPAGDFYLPASRFMRKVAGSEVATLANPDETSSVVLRQIFENANYGPISVGSFNGTTNTLTFPDGNGFVFSNPDILNSVSIASEITNRSETDPVFLGDLNAIYAPFSDISNSVSSDSVNLSLERNLWVFAASDFGVSFQASDTSLTAAGMQIGRGENDDDLSDFDPVASLGAYSSTFVLDGFVLVGMFSGGAGELLLDASTFSAFQLLVGDIGGPTNELDWNRATGTVSIRDGSDVTVERLKLADTHNAVGELEIDSSSLSVATFLVAENWAGNWEGTDQLGGIGHVSITGSTVEFTNDAAEVYSPSFIIGRGDYTTGEVVVLDSTLNGMKNVLIGSDFDVSETEGLGGTGSLELINSDMTYYSSENPGGNGAYFGIGYNGGVGTVTLSQSSIVMATNSVVIPTQEVPYAGVEGTYYQGLHVGAFGSTINSAEDFDATLLLDNQSYLEISNSEIGNTELFMAVGRGAGTTGYLKLAEQSEIVLRNDNSDIVSTFFGVGSADEEAYGTMVVNDSSVSVSGSAETNAFSVGAGGQGELTVMNGGSISVFTSGDGSNEGYFRVGDYGGSGSVELTGLNSSIYGDEYSVLMLGEKPEDFYQRAHYDAGNTAETYAGSTGVLNVSDGATVEFGTAGDGIPDIYVGEGGVLIADSNSTVIGDIQIIGNGFVSANLLDQVIS